MDSCGALLVLDEEEEFSLPLNDLVNGDLKKTGEDSRRAFLLLPSDFEVGVSWDFFDVADVEQEDDEEAGLLTFICCWLSATL